MCLERGQQHPRVCPLMQIPHATPRIACFTSVHPHGAMSMHKLSTQLNCIYVSHAHFFSRSTLHRALLLIWAWQLMFITKKGNVVFLHSTRSHGTAQMCFTSAPYLNVGSLQDPGKSTHHSWQ